MGNNWIENVSGKCPVEKGTMIDVQFEDGEVMSCIKAFESISGSDREATYAFWTLDGYANDIVKWRLHKPEQSLDEAIGQQSYPEDFAIQQELTYPQTNFKPSSEAQLRADEAARVSNKLSEKLNIIADIASKLARKNFSVADIKLVKDLLESVEEYEENH